MPQWRIIQPSSEAEWSAYYGLRYSVLRAPWNQPKGSERASDDPQSIHGLLLNEQGEALAVGRIHTLSETEAQIRFMAVNPRHRRLGLGKAILQYLEAMAQRRNPELSTICLQARDSAVPFYISQGYTIKEKTFLLFETIQHYLMEKPIPQIRSSIKPS